MVKMSPRYICTGSSVFAPSSKAVVGAVGPEDHIALRERAGEVARDQAADLLRLQVVGVVVAVREHVRADEDAPLHLGAEAFGAGAAVHVDQVAGILRAVAVAHAVEARQVRGRLRRRDHVVAGDAERGLRQLDLDRSRPATSNQRTRSRPRRTPARGRRRSIPSAADAQPLEVDQASSA
jgi:hypothetical protein